MNRLGGYNLQTGLSCLTVKPGMIIDISHVTPECARQVFSLTRAPVIFSHSNAAAVFDCPRNIPDHILDLVPANGGVVMLNFVPQHVAAEVHDAKLDDVLDHIFYVAGRIGWEHVGLGSDFDGVVSVIPGLEDVKCYPALLKAVLDRGATEDQLRLLVGENVLRVWQGVVRVRDDMKAAHVKPVEDVWEGREWWRFDGARQIPDPDPEDKMGYGWFAVDAATGRGWKEEPCLVEAKSML
jgi:membrane dipeptidase